MARSAADVIVIGGGVLGLVTARSLAEAGCTVTLVERQRVGGGTSRAGGGLMSPLVPWKSPTPLVRLASYSQPLARDLAGALARDTGIDPEYRTSGAIHLECDDIEAALAFARRSGLRADLLDEAGLAAVEPAAVRTGGPSLRLPDVAQIRNPRLLDALAADLRRRGVTLLEGAGEVRLEDGRGRTVRLAAGPHGRLQAAHTVVAAGAWSATLLAPLGIRLPVFPVRGQIVWYRLPRPVLRHVLVRDWHCVIPRQEGVALVGSTVENVGFDDRTTEEAAAELHAAAAGMAPLLGALAIQGQWAGLRPGTPDGVPLIGPLPGRDGLWVNTGHYHDGVHLAAGSAALLSALVGGRTPSLDPSPYDPGARMALDSTGAYNATV